MPLIERAGNFAGQSSLKELVELRWTELTEKDVIGVAWSYYFFSIQFRENLEIALELFPNDEKLVELREGEIETDNLSPYPDVADDGEVLNHDEFMRRALLLSPVTEEDENRFRLHGETYLRDIRSMDRKDRALSIGCYETGGLQKLFETMLTAPAYDNKSLAAFRYFMEQHIKFDSDPVSGHGALSKHISGEESTNVLWGIYKRLLLACTPSLQQLVST